jgi:large subunit ribosomal protein L13
MSQARVIDGKDLIVGRLCTYIAKKSLQGHSFEVINIDQTIFTGNRVQIFARFKQARERGRTHWGPYIGRSAKDLFKRSLKNMLPIRTTRGQEAMKRIKVYKGVPERFKDVEKETLQIANVSKVPNLKFIRLEELTKFLGGK